MVREAASRIMCAFHRYFSVKPAAVAPEVASATESAGKAVAAAQENKAANERLADEMSRLNGLIRASER